MLTWEQRTHFQVFGFLVLRQAFSDEVARISSTFDEVLRVDRQGRPFDGRRRQALLGFVEQRADLSRLVEDDRIYSAVEALLGPGFVWVGSDGNLYVGDTGWHPDGSTDYQRIKVAFYLDPVRKDSGCLRVIPGSHRAPLHDDLKRHKPTIDASESPYGVAGAEVPAFPLESNPGDVVLFNQNLWHASFGGTTGRRMFTLNFAARATAEEHVQYLRQTYEMNLRHVREMGYTQTGRVYTDNFLQSNRPRIQGMVAKLVELGLR